MFYIRRVIGESMLPTLRPGHLIIFVKWFRYKPGDIVIVKHQGKEKVKRVKEKVKKDLYIAGDNPDFSTDSRHFGWVPKKHIKGKMLHFKKK